MRVRYTFASLALVVSAAHSALAQTAQPRVFSPQDEGAFAPAVDVWLNQVDYSFGEKIRPSFVGEPGAYVAVIRVTTDGELRILYPRRPSEQRPYVIGQLAGDRIPYSAEPGFILRESSGTGFVFAISSYTRFDFSYFRSGDTWSIARLAASGRFYHPFEAVRRFVDRTLDERAEYSMDYVTYEVHSGGVRSRYASRLAYYSDDDYLDACFNTFGVRYYLYCRGSYGGYYAGGGYYGPYIGRSYPPTVPTSTGRDPRRARPLVHDPVVPQVFSEPRAAEGRFPQVDRAEAAERARHERLLRDARPRMEPRSEPRIILPREESRPQRAESPRSEPRMQPREIPREQPRAEPRMQAAPRIEAPRMERPQVKVDQTPRPQRDQ